MRVILSSSAHANLRDYRQWLIRGKGKSFAEQWMDGLIGWIAEVAHLPYGGSPRPDLGPTIRSRIFRRSVTMIYAVRDDEVLVLRVLGRGRNITADLIHDPE